MRQSSPLRSQLENISLEIMEKVNRAGGLEIPDFVDLVFKPKDYTVYEPLEVQPDSVLRDIDPTCDALGRELFNNSTAAYCVFLAGDPNDWCRIFDSDNTIIDTSMCLAPKNTNEVWVVAPAVSHKNVRDYLGSRGMKSVKVIPAFETFQLNPDNTLDFIAGSPSLVPCGDGDVFDALHFSGLLTDFRANGGKYVYVCDTACTLPPHVLVGLHSTMKSHVTWRVKGGSGVDVLVDHTGIDQIVSKRRLDGCDPNRFAWSSMNAFVFDADVAVDTISLPWVRTREAKNSKTLDRFVRRAHSITSVLKTTFVSE